VVSPVTGSSDRCGSCGNDLRPKARFCDECGSAVSPRPPIGEHKQVTVLFADVVGSMRVAAALDAERLQEIMNDLFNRAAAVVQRYQGTVDKFTGDGLMALFGAPVALEDHALRACIAALEIQTVAEELAADVNRRDGVALQIRVGLNSGDVVAGEIGSGPGRYTAVGHPVGIAQRMEGGAPPGGVLSSLSTASLVEGAVRFGAVEDIDVKGADGPMPARRLLAIESDRMVVGRNEGLMLGRDAELSWLRDSFDDNHHGPIGIVGAPGLGKSRLIGEFAAIAVRQGVEVVVARCESHTSTLPFRALSRLLRAWFKVDGLSDAEAREHTVTQYNGLLAPDSADAQILFDAMAIADANAPPLQVSVDGRRRRLVDVMSQTVLARSARVVFVLEDAHWIDPPSDDVLAAFASTLGTTASIFVTTYRPEYGGALHRYSGRTMTLQPLTESTAVRLVGQLLGSDRSLTGLAERIALAAVGNPFFVEEIVRDLAGRDVLSGSRGGYRLMGDIDKIAVPATVQAVLAARIDRLPAEAKSILNAASVIGTRFDVDTLRALLPESASAHLAELVSAELLDQTEFVPRQRYCFRHPLVRTVAYESQLSTTRVQAHRRLATAIEARTAGAADENAALIAAHLEGAGELAAAYRWHMRATEWLRPRDLPAARAQWEKALAIADRLPEEQYDVIAMRLAPLTMLISTMLYVGDDADTDQRYRRLRDLTTKTGDLTSLAIASAGRIQSFVVNNNRVPDAALLAAELEEMVSHIDCEAADKSVILNAVAMARMANCQFAEALHAVDQLLALRPEVPEVEVAPANAIRGAIEVCLGDYEKGRLHLVEAIEQARTLSPVLYGQVLFFSCATAVLGMSQTDELGDDVREALRRAESFGDISGIAIAQYAYGTALLRAQNASNDHAIDMLQRAQTNSQKHKVITFARATIDADLAVDAARKGQQDDAINQLHASFSLHMRRGFRPLATCPGEALVELLIDRGGIDDIAEAHRIVDEWRAERPDIPALDLWWLKSRALLAKAEGNSDAYAELTNEYLALCERLDARGRLAQARRMVG
jgi:adenylate cyclase